MFFLKVGCGLLFVAALAAPAWAQAAGAQSAPSPAQAAAAQSGDELAQMRDDLNKLESLNLNMSAEIEFLRDQNLQILLRTNSQMWGVLIRDLRRQIDREEQRTKTKPAAAGRTAPPDK
jgi:hypothetical protein